MLLEAATLEQIATTNLLSITISETQLSTNFQLILKALKGHDSTLAEHSGKINSLESLLNDSLTSQNQLKASLQQALANLEAQQQAAQEKSLLADQRIARIEASLLESFKVNPEQENQEKEQRQLAELVRLLEARVGEAEGSIGVLGEKTGELGSRLAAEEVGLSKAEEEIAQVKADLASLMRTKSAKGHSEADELKNLIREIEGVKSGLNLLSSELRGDMATIKENSLPKLKEEQDDLSRRNKKMSDEIWKLNEQLYNSDKHSREMELSSQLAMDNLLKRLQDIEDEINKVRMEPPTTSRSISAKPEWSPLSHSPEESAKKESEREADASSFKKEMIEKLKQQRSDFNRAIKRLDQAAHRKEGDQDRLGELEERLLRLEHLLEGKVDDEGLKKWMKYIENKISYIYRIVNVETSEEDGIIARKNWFCLSCDRKLEPYKGKVGHHLHNAQVKGRTIDHDVVGGGMLFRNKSKFELPQFKK